MSKEFPALDKPATIPKMRPTPKSPNSRKIQRKARKLTGPSRRSVQAIARKLAEKAND